MTGEYHKGFQDMGDYDPGASFVQPLREAIGGLPVDKPKVTDWTPRQETESIDLVFKRLWVLPPASMVSAIAATLEAFSPPAESPEGLSRSDPRSKPERNIYDFLHRLITVSQVSLHGEKELQRKYDAGLTAYTEFRSQQDEAFSRAIAEDEQQQTRWSSVMDAMEKSRETLGNYFAVYGDKDGEKDSRAFIFISPAQETPVDAPEKAEFIAITRDGPLKIVASNEFDLRENFRRELQRDAQTENDVPRSGYRAYRDPNRQLLQQAVTSREGRSFTWSTAQDAQFNLLSRANGSDVTAAFVQSVTGDSGKQTVLEKLHTALEQSHIPQKGYIPQR